MSKLSDNLDRDTPKWLLEKVKEVTPNIEALFPIRWDWEQDMDDIFEILFWPAPGVHPDHGEFHEDFTVHLMPIVNLFDDGGGKVQSVQSSALRTTVAVEFEQLNRTVILVFLHTPPEDVPPVYEVLNEENCCFRYLDDVDPVRDLPPSKLN